MAGHIALVVASADKLEVTAGPWDWDMLGLSWFSNLVWFILQVTMNFGLWLASSRLNLRVFK